MNQPGGVRRDGPSREEREKAEDQLGFNETSNYLSASMRPLVPQRLAVKGLTVDVDVQEGPYISGEPLSFDVVFRNRLPVPIELESPTSRLWYWAIDDKPFASDERPYIRDKPNSLAFRARETKVVTQVWNTRFRREGNPVRWIPAKPGTYTIKVVFETVVGRNPTGTATVRIES